MVFVAGVKTHSGVAVSRPEMSSTSGHVFTPIRRALDQHEPGARFYFTGLLAAAVSLLCSAYVRKTITSRGPVQDVRTKAALILKTQVQFSTRSKTLLCVEVKRFETLWFGQTHKNPILNQILSTRLKHFSI